MLKTNGSVSARESYSNDAGSIVCIPSRPFTDRVPFGLVKFSITYRFAGVISLVLLSSLSIQATSSHKLRRHRMDANMLSFTPDRALSMVLFYEITV
jgi:hypothetical protein